MNLWVRVLVTALVMLAMSYAGAQLWWSALGFPLPSYLAGMLGGLSALPIWELLKRWAR